MKDSVEKIITTYFRHVAAEPFTFNGVRYEPQVLQVSPMIFRGFVCPEGCGACCQSYTLDYIPGEERPYELPEREIEFDGRKVKVWSDLQENSGYYCHNLRQEDGRCGIHGRHAFSCDFELLRFFGQGQGETEVGEGGRRFNRLSHALFGRGWAMTQVSGEKGAKCYMTPIAEEHVADVSRKLTRLLQWTTYFSLKTCLPEILEWVATGPHEVAGHFNTQFAAVRKGLWWTVN